MHAGPLSVASQLTMIRKIHVQRWQGRPRRHRDSGCCRRRRRCCLSRDSPALHPDIVAQVAEFSITSIESPPRYSEALLDVLQPSSKVLDPSVGKVLLLEGRAGPYVQGLRAIVQGAARRCATRCGRRGDEEDRCQQPCDTDPHGRDTPGPGVQRLCRCLIDDIHLVSGYPATPCPRGRCWFGAVPATEGASTAIVAREARRGRWQLSTSRRLPLGPSRSINQGPPFGSP